MKSKYFILTLLIIFIFNSFLFTQEDSIEGKIIQKIVFKGLNKAKKKDVMATIMTREGTPLDLMMIDQDYQRLFGLGYFEDIIISTDAAYDEETKEPLPNSVVLIFEFIEKPTVRKTIFRGNKNVSFGFLMEDVTIRRGDFLDLSKVHSDISAIIENYKERGFNYAKVDYEIFQNEDLKEQNRVDLIFSIVEGIETYVSEIIITGNSKVSDFTIKNKMKTKERKYFGLQKGVFNESTFYQDIEDIKTYYKEQGYYLVDILEPDITRYEIEEDEEVREIIQIKIHIEEGNQYRYGGMIITGNKIFTGEDLSFGMKLKEGQLFNYTKFQEDLFALQTKYTDAGYVQTVINDEYVIDDENKTITVKIDIQESRRSYIEAIYFRGNEKTKNYVLERATVTEVGEIFNSNKLMSSIINLYNLGFFSKVDYDIQQGSAPGLLKITYLLEEQLTAEIRFGLQIPANKWPPDITLFGELTERNFLGRELEMSGKIDVSLYKQGFDFRVDDPWFLNYPWNIGASVKFYHNWNRTVLRKISEEDKQNYRDANDLDDDDEVTTSDVRTYYYEKYSNNDTSNPNYLNAYGNFFDMGIHDITFEASTRTGYRFAKYFSVLGNISCEPIYTYMPLKLPNNNFDWVDNIAEESGYFGLLNEYGWDWSVKAKVSTTFSVNTTKRRINPYEGIKWSFTTGYTFGHYDSVSLSTKFTAYWKILDVSFNNFPFKNVIVFNAQASMIFPGFRNLGGHLEGIGNTQGKGPIMYPTDYLIVDGLFAGRGWSNSIGATSYTDRLTDKIGYFRLDFSLEYRVPLYERIIWMAAFIDMVNLVQGPQVYVNHRGNVIRDNSRAWEWWSGDNNKYPGYEPFGIDNWYGSFGVGVELTFPQLPLSFFVVKRFKLNYYGGLEWTQDQRETGNLDFVLSIVGYYF